MTNAHLRRLWSRIREEPRPLRFLASRILWRLGLSHLLIIHRNGYRIRFHPSAISANVWTELAHETEEERFVASTLRSGDCFVDVGSNVGLLALRGATVVGASGTVIAIEAHPRTYGFLLENVELNGFGSVRAMHCAVGEAEGTVAFTDYGSDDQNHVMLGGTGATVPVHRLDDLIPNGPIALLKVDVEGFELAVFRGATSVLSRTRVVLFESCDALAARYGFSLNELLSLLRGRGFTLFRIVGDQLQPIIGPSQSLHCENLVAIRE